MFKKSGLAGVAVSALICASAANAQQFNRSVVFGDSLSDIGNIATANGGSVPNYLPLQLKQFSNGPVFASQLFGPATNFFTTTPANVNAGNVNFAFGGSRTTGPQTPGPTTAEQIGSFLLLGGKFGANDVVTMWGGANNLFQQSTVASAAGAATDIGNQVRQLGTAGARTIVVYNLPDFGSLPANFGTPAQASASQLSTFFNSSLATSVGAAAAASPGANVISVPVDQIFSAIAANPSAFGFTNVTQACVASPACIGANGAGFLFWDTVHPTTAGHALVAEATRQYLFAPARATAVATAFGETAFGYRRTAAVAALGFLDDVPAEPTMAPARVTKTVAQPMAAPGQWRYFVNLTGEFGQSNGSFQNGALTASGVSSGKAYDYKSGGLRVAGIRDFGAGWTGGAAVQVQGGKIEGGRLRLEANSLTFGGDIFARWTSAQGYFVKLGLGASLDQFSQYRYDTLGPLQNSGQTMALSTSAMAEAGYDFRMGQLTLTPAARIGYLYSRLDGFNEAGVVAPVAYGARTTNALVGAAELRAAYRLTPTTRVTALVGYEDYLGTTVKGSGRLIANTAQPFSIAGRDPVGQGIIFGVGADMNFGSWTGNVSYRGAVGDDKTVRHSASIGASVKY